MDSTLGKILASIFGLLALAGVVVAGIVGYSNARTNSAVADVATLATKITGDYVNNPAGYATLSNQVAIAAGDVPADMLQGASIVNAWGSAVTIGPMTGNAKDFSISLGLVPQAACVQLLTTDGSLMGASVGGKQLALPMTPSTAAAACAGSASGGRVAVAVDYGQSRVSTAPTTLSVQYLLVGGGGGASGGTASVNYGAGGAGGVVRAGNATFTVGQAYTITVGAGGAAVGVGTPGAGGASSVLGSGVSLTATGGALSVTPHAQGHPMLITPADRRTTEPTALREVQVPVAQAVPTVRITGAWEWPRPSRAPKSTMGVVEQEPTSQA